MCVCVRMRIAWRCTCCSVLNISSMDVCEYKCGNKMEILCMSKLYSLVNVGGVYVLGVCACMCEFN